MTTDSFYAKSTRINSPTKNYGIAKLIGGIILLLLYMPEIFSISSFLKRLRMAPDDFIFAGLFKYGIAILMLLIGLSLIFKGIKSLKKITITPELPPPLDNYLEVIKSL